MRILHVADRWTDRGGAYHYLSSLIARQLEEHDVELWVGRIDRDVPLLCKTSQVIGLDARSHEPVDLPPVSCDVVHVHNVVNPAVLERLGLLDEVRKRMTVQDHRFFCPGRGKLTLEGKVCVEAMAPSACRGCFSDEGYFDEMFGLTGARLGALAPFELEVLSHYMKRELMAVGVPAERIAVARPDVHFDVDTPCSQSPPCVLFAGRLVEAKGVWDAVEAWKCSGVRLPLVFAGTGPLREELERRGFTVLGWVPHEHMPALYRSAKALLMPSRWQEPFGLAGLEAQMLGTPVIAWASGAVSEWHRGPLVPWGDVGRLAEELRKAVGHVWR